MPMKGGIMFEQKDMILIPFPYSDLTGSKKRPALIISNNKLNQKEDRICCLVTSNEPKESGSLINSFEKGNLPFRSWVKPHRIFTISKKIIVKKLCKVDDSFHKKVIKSINEHIS